MGHPRGQGWGGDAPEDGGERPWGVQDIPWGQRRATGMATAQRQGCRHSQGRGTGMIRDGTWLFRVGGGPSGRGGGHSPHNGGPRRQGGPVSKPGSLWCPARPQGSETQWWRPFPRLPAAASPCRQKPGCGRERGCRRGRAPRGGPRGTGDSPRDGVTSWGGGGGMLGLQYLTKPELCASGAIILRAVKASSLTRLQKVGGVVG